MGDFFRSGEGFGQDSLGHSQVDTGWALDHIILYSQRFCFVLLIAKKVKEILCK